MSHPFNLGGPVITNNMTLGQLKLLARCIRVAMDTEEFRCGLTDEENEEAQCLADMFEDPELELSTRDLRHGFCL
jgi:hypothetical protein